MAKKKHSRKSRDKENYKAKNKLKPVSKEKKERRKKSSNRASRVYQRKARVGNDPKKIFARVRYIFRRIFWDDLRCRLAKDIVKAGDLDHFVYLFKGTVEDGLEIAADTVDLMVELVSLLKQSDFYFRPQYSQRISLKYQDKKVEISWPKTLNGSCAHAFTNEFILIYAGKLYHNHWYRINAPTKFTGAVVPLQKAPAESKKKDLCTFLERFSLSYDDIEGDLVTKDEEDCDQDFIVPRKTTKRVELS